MGCYIYGTILSKYKHNIRDDITLAHNINQQYALFGSNGDPTAYNFHIYKYHVKHTHTNEMSFAQMTCTLSAYTYKHKMRDRKV